MNWSVVKHDTPLYIVRACCWQYPKHAYVVGVFSNKSAAERAAVIEEYWRGGKYECRVDQSLQPMDRVDPAVEAAVIQTHPDLFKNKSEEKLVIESWKKRTCDEDHGNW